MKKLNLGCWKDYRKGWVNLDNNKNQKADIYHDLNKFPYPFEDNEFDEIFISHVLEHLENPLKVLEELWRISKPESKIIIFVPHWSSYIAFSDLTHKHFFSAESFHYFDINDEKYYSNSTKFKTIKKRYVSFRSDKKTNKFYEWICINIFEKLANKVSPMVVEQILCKFLPINEIRFELKTIKI